MEEKWKIIPQNRKQREDHRNTFPITENKMEIFRTDNFWKIGKYSAT